MTHLMEIEYDDSILFSLGMSEDRFNEESRLILAAKLYEERRLSSGQAASLAGKGRVEFLYSMARLGIFTCNLSNDDIASEMEFIENA